MAMTLIPSTANALSVNYVSSNPSITKDSESNNYFITYKDIDMNDIEKEAEEKRSDYIYTLYEQDLTQTEFERLSTEYYINIRLELIKKAYSEKADQILKELGINNADVFCSAYSPTIICPLTDEQKTNAEKNQLIEKIEIYDSIEPLPQTEIDLDSTKEDSELNNYFITYKDIDMNDIEKEAEEKRSDYIYTLYEQDLTQTEFERLSTEYYTNIRSELIKKAYSEKADQILKELGINNADVFCSTYSPTIICPLTDEQKTNAEKNQLIEKIEIYDSIEPLPQTGINSYSTKEEFISILTKGKEAEELFGKGIKIDAELNCKKEDINCDYLIIYGLKTDQEIDDVIDKLSLNSDLRIIKGQVISRSGTLFSIISDNINTTNKIYGFVFVDDEYPSWVSKQDIATFTQSYNFNPSKYIIKLGDTNGDYIIDARDASDILSTYAKLSTEKGLILNDDEKQRMDANKDDKIDAIDASLVLSYYAYLSTEPTGSIINSLKDYSQTINNLS